MNRHFFCSNSGYFRRFQPLNGILIHLLRRYYTPNDTNGRWLHNLSCPPSMYCWDWLSFERFPMQRLHHLLMLISACSQSPNMFLIVHLFLWPRLVVTMVIFLVTTWIGFVVLIGECFLFGLFLIKYKIYK